MSRERTGVVISLSGRRLFKVEKQFWKDPFWDFYRKKQDFHNILLSGAATEKAHLPRFSLVLGIWRCFEVEDDVSCLGMLEYWHHLCETYCFVFVRRCLKIASWWWRNTKRVKSWWRGNEGTIIFRPPRFISTKSPVHNISPQRRLKIYLSHWNSGKSCPTDRHEVSWAGRDCLGVSHRWSHDTGLPRYRANGSLHPRTVLASGLKSQLV